MIRNKTARKLKKRGTKTKKKQNQKASDEQKKTRNQSTKSRGKKDLMFALKEEYSRLKGSIFKVFLSIFLF